MPSITCQQAAKNVTESIQTYLKMVLTHFPSLWAQIRKGKENCNAKYKARLSEQDTTQIFCSVLLLYPQHKLPLFSGESNNFLEGRGREGAHWLWLLQHAQLLWLRQDSYQLHISRIGSLLKTLKLVLNVWDTLVAHHLSHPVLFWQAWVSGGTSQATIVIIFYYYYLFKLLAILLQ